MPAYSKISQERLSTCHTDWQVIMQAVIRNFDNSILCGHRGKAEQNAAYASGNSKVQWPNGKHNSFPSMAVDAAPYPINWKDRERMYFFAGHVIGVAEQLFDQGVITHKVRYGGDWDQDTEVTDNNFDDLVHFELYKP